MRCSSPRAPGGACSLRDCPSERPLPGTSPRWCGRFPHPEAPPVTVCHAFPHKQRSGFLRKASLS